MSKQQSKGAVVGIPSESVVGVPGLSQTPPAGPTDPVESAKGAAEAEAPPAPAEPVLPPPVAATGAVPKAAPQYRVTNPGRVTVSWGSPPVDVRFNPGDIISEDSYGDGAIEKFRNSGVRLEEV